MVKSGCHVTKAFCYIACILYCNGVLIAIESGRREGHFDATNILHKYNPKETDRIHTLPTIYKRFEIGPEYSKFNSGSAVEENIYPSARVEPSALVQDSFTNKLINSLTSEDNTLEEKELEGVLRTRKKKTSEYASQPHDDTKNDNNHEGGNDESKHAKSYGDEYNYKDDYNNHGETNNESEEHHEQNEKTSEHISDDKGDGFPDGNSMPSSIAEDIDAEYKAAGNMKPDDTEKGLVEYQHYPNEYTTNEEEGHHRTLGERSGKNEHKDKNGVNIDTELLKKELSVIRAEDEELGAALSPKLQKEKDVHENRDTRHLEEFRDYRDGHKEEEDHRNKEKRAKYDKSINKTTEEEEDDDELDKETSELLNINVGADGKIVETNSRRMSSKEAIFDKENLLPYLKMPVRNVSTFVAFKKHASSLDAGDEAKKLYSDIASLKNDLRSSLVRSNAMITQDVDDEISNFNVRKMQLPHIFSLNKMINSSLPQSLLLDTMSPVKKTMLQHPIISKAAVKKALFSPLHERKVNSRVKDIERAIELRRGIHKFNTNQTDVLKHMYPKKYTKNRSNKRILHAQVNSISRTKYRTENADKRWLRDNKSKVMKKKVKDILNTYNHLNDYQKKVMVEHIGNNDVALPSKEARIVDQFSLQDSDNHAAIGRRTIGDNPNSFAGAPADFTTLYEGNTESNLSEQDSFVNKWRTSSESPRVSKRTKSQTGLKRQNIFQRRHSMVQLAEAAVKPKVLRCTIKSVGCFDPPYHGSNCDDTVGSIVINGVEMSQNKAGFNFVLIDFKTGEMEKAVSFDTHGEAGAYEKLEDFLGGLDMWKIICVAVKDDAKNYLPDSAIKTFARIGASDIISQKIEFRSSYAFIGLTGPESARVKMPWIREENSRAADGPSVISVTINAGLAAFQAAGGKLSKVMKGMMNAAGAAGEAGAAGAEGVMAAALAGGAAASGKMSGKAAGQAASAAMDASGAAGGGLAGGLAGGGAGGAAGVGLAGGGAVGGLMGGAAARATEGVASGGGAELGGAAAGGLMDDTAGGAAGGGAAGLGGAAGGGLAGGAAGGAAGGKIGGGAAGGAAGAGLAAGAAGGAAGGEAGGGVTGGVGGGEAAGGIAGGGAAGGGLADGTAGGVVGGEAGGGAAGGGAGLGGTAGGGLAGGAAGGGAGGGGASLAGGTAGGEAGGGGAGLGVTAGGGLVGGAAGGEAGGGAAGFGGDAGGGLVGGNSGGAAGGETGGGAAGGGAGFGGAGGGGLAVGTAGGEAGAGGTGLGGAAGGGLAGGASGGTVGGEAGGGGANLAGDAAGGAAGGGAGGGGAGLASGAAGGEAGGGGSGLGGGAAGGQAGGGGAAGGAAGGGASGGVAGLAAGTAGGGTGGEAGGDLAGGASGGAAGGEAGGAAGGGGVGLAGASGATAGGLAGGAAGGDSYGGGAGGGGGLAGAAGAAAGGEASGGAIGGGGALGGAASGLAGATAGGSAGGEAGGGGSGLLGGGAAGGETGGGLASGASAGGLGGGGVSASGSLGGGLAGGSSSGMAGGAVGGGASGGGLSVGSGGGGGMMVGGASGGGGARGSSGGISGGSISGAGGISGSISGGSRMSGGGRSRTNSLSIGKSKMAQRQIDDILSGKTAEFINSLKPSELARIIAPVDPVGSLLEAAKSLGIKTYQLDVTPKKKSSKVVTPSTEQVKFLATVLNNLSKGNSLQEILTDKAIGRMDTAKVEQKDNATNLEKLQSTDAKSEASELKHANDEAKAAASNAAAATHAGAMVGAVNGAVQSAKAVPHLQGASLKGSEDPYGNMGMQAPGPVDIDASSSAPLAPLPGTADSGESTMEAAADISGSRNVGESRLASALSALGIPDAGATGIASLMASGFVAAGANNKKDATLKLGLAAKLSKSIADLGGRGAASAAGISSLNEMLKDGRDMSVARLADNIGQALQRVGGAGAAVGYAALAAALKAVGNSRSPGALVGGIILALAEQGAAPGTAGLAALAAGLGGSGADALAGGLGGSLPNVIAATRTNNYMAGGPMAGGSTAGGPIPALGGTAFPPPSPAGGSGFQFHPGNIDSEYTGQGPIGSITQGSAVKPLSVQLGQNLQAPAAAMNMETNKAMNGLDPITVQQVLSKMTSLNQNKVPESVDKIAAESASYANVEKMIAEALGHKEGSSLPEVVASVNRKDQGEMNVESATQTPESASHLPMGVRLGGGELVTVGNPSLIKSKTEEESDNGNCENLSYSKGCIGRCGDKKTLIGRFVDVASSDKKAMIKVNGEDWSKDEGGFNIVVVDFNSGEVEASETFDTEIDGGAAKAMSNFIRSLSPGKVIIGATRGNAGALMIDEAYKTLSSAGAQAISTHHLKQGDKYAFVGINGDSSPWAKEELANTRGSIAEINMPIIVGPGAMRNSCLCLQSCKEHEAKSSSKDKLALGSEKAYADMGGDTPIVAGSAGTRRDAAAKTPKRDDLSLNNDKKAETDNDDDNDNDNDDDANDSKDDDNDEDDKSDSDDKSHPSNTHKHTSLVVVPITKAKAKVLNKNQNNEPNDIDKGDDTNYRKDENERKIFHQVEQINKIADKELKLHNLTRKLETLRDKHKKHTQVNPDSLDSKESVGLGKVLSSSLLKITHGEHQDSDSSESYTQKPFTHETSETLKHSFSHPNIKQRGLSLLNDPYKFQDTTKTTESTNHDGSQDHNIKSKGQKPSTFDDIYSTIGNNLHSRKSERPRPKNYWRFGLTSTNTINQSSVGLTSTNTINQSSVGDAMY